MIIILISLGTFIFLSILIIMYIYLLCQKIKKRRNKIKQENWLEKRTATLYDFFLTGRVSRLMVPTKRYHFEALENMFSNFLENYKIDDEFNPIQTFADTYFADHYSNNLKHQQWSKRMNTLFFIDLFQMSTMIEQLLSHLNDKRCSPEEKLEIFLLLASFNYKELMSLLKTSGSLPTFMLNILVGRLINEHNVDRFVETFEQFNLAWKGAILEVVRDKHLRTETLQSLLESLLYSHISELRLKALKTIASLGYLSSISVFERWIAEQVNTARWLSPQLTGERLMASRLMGSIRSDSFLPYLEQLLGDQVYIIRSEAAKSIRQYKNGRALLQELAHSHSDQFARAICQEWLERSLDYE